MKFEITDDLARLAKIPHDIFLTNLIGNHILWFVAALGLAGSFWQPLALVPVFSFSLLFYTLKRAHDSRQQDSWFVMVHWQIAAERSRFFIYMLLVVLTVSFLGWMGYTFLGMKKVTVMALIGGVGLLPIMVTVLVLILMESDALHQAAQQKVSKRMAERFPYPVDMVVLEDDTPGDEVTVAPAEVKS